MRTTGKQCDLAATGVYQPSLRSPWLAAEDFQRQITVTRHEIPEQPHFTEQYPGGVAPAHACKTRFTDHPDNGFIALIHAFAEFTGRQIRMHKMGKRVIHIFQLHSHAQHASSSALRK